MWYGMVYFQIKHKHFTGPDGPEIQGGMGDGGGGGVGGGGGKHYRMKH